MSKLFRNTSFNLGFWITFLLFVFLNYWVYSTSYSESLALKPIFGTGSEAYVVGFPFYFYQTWTGNPNYSDFRLFLLIANIAIAVICSLVVGFIFKLVWAQITEKKVINDLKKNKGFMYGFSFGISISLLIQIISFIIYFVSKTNFRNPPGMNIHMLWWFGLPFPIYYGGELVWRGIVANILVTIIFSLIIGSISKFIWTKIQARKLK